MRATKVLTDKGLSIQHMHISTIKPFTDPSVLEALSTTKYGAITMENHSVIGGLGESVANVIATNGLGTPLEKVGLMDTYTHGASKMYLMKKYGLDAMTLIKAVEKLTDKSLNIKEEDLENVRFVDFSAV